LEMSAASGTGSLPLGVSEIYLLGLQTLLSKCVAEINTLSVSHQAALMEDRLLQAEDALALVNQRMVQLDGDVIALRQVVIVQEEQLSSVSWRTGVLAAKCDCLESSVSNLSSKQLSAGSDLAEVQSRVSSLEKSAVETARLCHPSAGLADIDAFGSRTEVRGKVTEKETSSPKEACPRQLLEELNRTQDAVASVSSETLKQSAISNKEKFRLLSHFKPSTGVNPSEFLDWLSKIERVASAANCAEDVLKCWLVANLVEGRLAHAYDALPVRSMKNWRKLKRSLIEKIVPPFYFERLRCELSLLKQRLNESLDSYVTRFCGKVETAYNRNFPSEFVDAQLVWQFICGLSCENLRLKALEQRCLTLAEVVDFVLELETLQHLAKSSTVETFELQNRPRSKPIPTHWFNRCFKCGVIGHCRRNWPRKQCSGGKSI